MKRYEKGSCPDCGYDQCCCKESLNKLDAKNSRHGLCEMCGISSNFLKKFHANKIRADSLSGEIFYKVCNHCFKRIYIIYYGEQPD